MYKIGVIGARDSVLAFAALGFAILEAADAESARTALHRAVRSGEFAVLLLTEDLAALLEQDIARYASDPLPAITSIPGCRGATGYGMAAIRRAAERAVGSDILTESQEA
ncbi:MAG: V-type ATP synthase subunit F [Clostridia bacterium]|nr:V-type ATP synthase subunit F [Clostridia bacterium]